ncbi:MAG: DUF3383 family protein [Clostridia bacterium]|nr:DUF3383 family protein [Clostridia bacterium]
MANNLSLSNVINVTLVPSIAGLSEFNTANLLLYSTESPIKDFGTDKYRVYYTGSAVAEDFGVNSLTYKMALAVFSQAPNILSNSGALIIALKEGSESQVEAFNRLKTTVLFCGWITTDTIANDLSAIETESSASVEEATISSAINAENNKIQFVVSNDSTDVDGIFTDIKNLGFTKTRCLFYGGTETEAKIMMASYASKAMSTVFEASLTTQTMHLKPLAGVLPDPVMTETLLTKCKTAGVDSYISIEGVACVFSTGANGFFDEVFNELWFVNAIQVAGFNYLRQTNTKIPQTEYGMTGLKNAYAQVCVRGVNNGFIAPGSWTSSDTFGNPDLFKNNIAVSGYYIYSTPVAQQNKADREARKAPLVQIAVKTAGAIHSTNVMIYVNL